VVAYVVDLGETDSRLGEAHSEEVVAEDQLILIYLF
jgi:hypothetical protein